MIVDFKNIAVSHLPAFKGGEKELAAKMFTDPLVKILDAELVPGASIGLHEHGDSCEVMFFTEGQGTVIYDGRPITVKAGDVHYCPKGHSHTLINDSEGPLRFHAVVPQQ